jgi:hypothetical protein
MKPFSHHRWARTGLAIVCAVSLSAQAVFANQPSRQSNAIDGQLALTDYAGCGARALYDGRLPTLPSAQGMQFAARGGVMQQLIDGGVLFDSSSANAAQGGYGSTAVPISRTLGFALRFSIAISAETHVSPDRAGFSVIVLDADARGIELGFWDDRIWAQEGGATPGLFTQAEGVTRTTTALTDYTLRFDGERYALRADATDVLSGPLRSYAAFAGFPDIYETPNFVFLGDNTTSASVTARINAITLDFGRCAVFMPLVGLGK